MLPREKKKTVNKKVLNASMHTEVFWKKYELTFAIYFEMHQKQKDELMGV